MIVLDTNVVSELMRPRPSDAVTGWVRKHRPGLLHTTAITVAEIHYGIERLPGGRRRSQLEAATADVFGGFEEQVLPFDASAAQNLALVVTQRDRVGAPIDGFDAQIASICRSRGAALATRNLKDFQATGVELIDPWRS